MSFLDVALLFWVVPSLIACLYLIHMIRVKDDKKPEDYDIEYILCVVIWSVVYPAVFVSFVNDSLLPFYEKYVSYSTNNIN